MTGIQVAWEDVFSVVDMIKVPLIAIVVALIVMIAVMIFARKVQKPTRGFVRIQSAIAFILFVTLMVNNICLGILRNTLEIVLGDTGSISAETAANSREVVEEVASQGILLLENKDNGLPLTDTTNINVFGWASSNPVYGGTGSGSVDISTATDLLTGLANAGFTTNKELTDFYTAYRADRPAITINNGQDWTLPEPTAASYSDTLLNNAKAFSDTAVLVLGRVGGEGADLPHNMGGVAKIAYNAEVGEEPWVTGSNFQGTKYTKGFYKNNGDYQDFEDNQSYLELSRTERDLVDLVTSNFDKVIVVYNGANPLQMGWINDYAQIKGLIVCPGAGATGFNALGKILKGTVNPSAKTVDTWLYDHSAAPYFNNIGHFAFDNMDDVTSAAKTWWERADGVVSFVNYVENIYVGYKFYETAYAEQMPGFDYDAVVQYPFGYGLSYTTFEQSMGELQVNGSTISVDVTVTNTGSVAGKDVVELYFDPPYTNGGIEKSAVNLVAFGKTGDIAPGASETVTLSFSVEDMASFDDLNNKCYVLEAGDYQISARTDAHTVVDTKTYNVPATIVYDENNKRATDLVAATSHFDYARGEANGLVFLSRANHFANYDIATAAPANYSLNRDVYNVTGNGTYNVEDYNNPADVMPTTGAKNGLTLYDLRGTDYDDPKWESLLDELSVDDMVEMIGFGGYGSPAIASVGKLKGLDADGPQGITANMSNGSESGLGYCSVIVLAMSWNSDIARTYAAGLGREARDLGVDGWYAPSMNIHRSAFAGRNFEYYSEDGVLSAIMAAAECQGIYEYNLYPFVKHFALNDQEINRNGMLTTWVTEQTMREIYLKPFEKCIKEAGRNPITVMASYNYIGDVWATANPDLLKTVLRDEWGFKGMVLSDYFGNYGYMDADKAVRGGCSMMLATAGNDAIMTDQTSATSVLAMRQASKDIMYTMVNSYTYETYDPNYVPGWIMTFYVVDGVIVAALAVCEVLAVMSWRKKKAQA